MDPRPSKSSFIFSKTAGNGATCRSCNRKLPRNTEVLDLTKLTNYNCNVLVCKGCAKLSSEFIIRYIKDEIRADEQNTTDPDEINIHNME